MQMEILDLVVVQEEIFLSQPLDLVHPTRLVAVAVAVAVEVRLLGQTNIHLHQVQAVEQVEIEQVLVVEEEMQFLQIPPTLKGQVVQVTLHQV
jgi:hypothetical protein